jgi:uncharacterized protein (DUF2225 family)
LRTTTDKELTTIATKTGKLSKTGKSDETKPKRSSKSIRKHVRRLKQEARKTAGTTHA